MNPKVRIGLLLSVLVVGVWYLWFTESRHRKATAKSVAGSAAAPIADERRHVRHVVAGHIKHREFKKLDDLARQYRKNDERTNEGWSKIASFYSGASNGLYHIEQHTGIEDVEKLLEEWKTASPESLTRILVEAEFKQDAAGRARGSGWAKDVRESQWKVYGDLLKESHLALVESAKITDEADPYTLLLYIMLGKAMGTDREQIQPIIEESITRFPTYEGTIREMAIYLLPRWHGEPGEMEAFAEDVANRLPAPQGDIMYARIAEKVWPYEKASLFENTSLSYDRIRTGFNALFSEYPKATDNMKLFLQLAVLKKDQATAHQMFEKIGEWPADDVKYAWGSPERLESIRQWAAEGGENPTDVTPLEIAVETGDLDEVTSAIANGGDVNRRTASGANLLNTALDNGDNDVAILLMENGADLTAEGKNGYKVVTAAAKAENLVVLKKALEAGFGINDPVGSTGWTLLHMTGEYNCPKTAEFLLTYPGINADCRTNRGWTPLIAAAQENAVDTAKVLMKYGADVNAGDNINITPLHQAAYSGAAEMIKLLLRMGADPAIKSTSGVQALDAAKGQHKAEVIALIEEALAKAK